MSFNTPVVVGSLRIENTECGLLPETVPLYRFSVADEASFSFVNDSLFGQLIQQNMGSPAQSIHLHQLYGVFLVYLCFLVHSYLAKPKCPVPLFSLFMGVGRSIWKS